MLLVYNKLASAEDNGVVLHNPLALTHPFLPCRPAYLEAWRHSYSNENFICLFFRPPGAANPQTTSFPSLVFALP